MDNQTSYQPLQPIQPTAAMQPVAKLPKAHKGLKLALIIFVVAAIGALSYLFITTNSKLNKTKNDLAVSEQKKASFEASLNTTRSELDKEKAAKDFVAKYNNAALSNADCSGKKLAMFDVHINDKYAVYRYLCENTSYPIRIGAFQKGSDDKWSFTYGDSTVKTNRLPDYIYNSEPDFFGPVYGATKF